MEAYFDNSATTKVMDAAAKLMLKVMKEDYGNPSARHRKGLEAEHYIKEARTNIARTLRVQEKEIFSPPGERSPITWPLSVPPWQTAGRESTSSAPGLNMLRYISRWLTWKVRVFR